MKKVKDKIPNYKGFVLHIEEYNKHFISFGINDLIRLSKKYNCPIPNLKNER